MRVTLSTVVCNYNHADYLDEQIEAVAAQSRRPDEFILIDDRSTDHSLDVIQAAIKRHSWIQFHQNEQNLGAMASYAKGIARAACDYISLPGADDRIQPGFYESAMRLAEQYPEAGVILAPYRIVMDGKEVGSAKAPLWSDALYASPERYKAEILDAAPPSFSLSGSTIYHRERLIEMGGYRPELDTWADTFVIHAIALKYGCCYSPEIATDIRIHDSNESMRWINDPERLLRTIRRSADAMRSSEFKTLFPQDYVNRWEREYKKQIIDGYLKHRRRLNGNLYSDQLSRAGQQAPALFRYPVIVLIRLARCLEYILDLPKRITLNRCAS